MSLFTSSHLHTHVFPKFPKKTFEKKYIRKRKSTKKKKKIKKREGTRSNRYEGKRYKVTPKHNSLFSLFISRFIVPKVPCTHAYLFLFYEFPRVYSRCTHHVYENVQPHLELLLKNRRVIRHIFLISLTLLVCFKKGSLSLSFPSSITMLNLNVSIVML